MLVVFALNAQESTERNALKHHFTGLQVQALIALIEDDRSKLSSMVADGDNLKKPQVFSAIRNRHASRVLTLNQLAKSELELPTETES